MSVAYGVGKQPQKGETADILLVMTDALSFIDLHQTEDKHSHVLSNLIKYVHHEYVERRVEQNEDQSEQSIQSLRDSLRISLDIVVPLFLFDIVLVPPENLCDLSYSQGKQIYQEYRDRNGLKTYPGITMTLLCERDPLLKCFSHQDANDNVPDTKNEKARYSFAKKVDIIEDQFVLLVCNGMTEIYHSVRSSDKSAAEEIGEGNKSVEKDTDTNGKEEEDAGGDEDRDGDTNNKSIDDFDLVAYSIKSELLIATFLDQKNPLPEILSAYNPIVNVLPLLDIAANSNIVTTTQMLGMALANYFAFVRLEVDQELLESIEGHIFSPSKSLCSQITTLVQKIGNSAWDMKLGNDNNAAGTINELVVQRLARFEPKAAEAIQHLDIGIKDVQNAAISSLSIAVHSTISSTDNEEYFLSILETITESTFKEETCQLTTSTIELFSQEQMSRLQNTVCKSKIIAWIDARALAKKLKKEKKALAKKKEEEEKKKIEEKKEKLEEEKKALAKYEKKMAQVIATGKTKEQSMEEHTEHVIAAVDYSPDGKQVISVGNDGAVIIWSIENKKQNKKQTRLLGHDGHVNSVSWSSNGKYIATSGSDGTARIWNAVLGDEVTKLEGKTGSWLLSSDNIKTIVFSKQNNIVATISESKAGVELYRVPEGTLISTISDWFGIQSIAFSPDGTTIVTAGGQGTLSTDHFIRGWSVETGEQLWEFEEKFVIGLSLSMEEERKKIATASKSGRVCIFVSHNMKDWKEERCWVQKDSTTGENDPARAVVFSTNMNEQDYIISTHESGFIYLWHPNNLNAYTFTRGAKEHAGKNSVTTSIAFSPGGRFVVSGLANTIKTWFVPPLELSSDDVGDEDNKKDNKNNE